MRARVLLLLTCLLLPSSVFAQAPPRNVADLIAAVAPSVVQIVTDCGAGSGVATAYGVLTDAPVIDGASVVTVVSGDGRRVQAAVASVDFRPDLARLDAPIELPPLAPEPAQQQRIGEPVFVLGYPRPFEIGAGQVTLTSGLVSAIRPLGDVLYLQTDAAMNPGNSGGAVVNGGGALVDIATRRVPRAEGLNLAVAGEEVLTFVQAPPTLPSADLSLGMSLSELAQEVLLEFDQLQAQAFARRDPSLLHQRATPAMVARVSGEINQVTSRGGTLLLELVDAHFEAIRRPAPSRIEVDSTEIWNNRLVDSRGVLVRAWTNTVPQTNVLTREGCVWKLADGWRRP